MNLGTALVHGLIWSMMWCAAVNFIMMRWPHVFLHDYPKELQEIITLPPFTKKKTAYTVTAIAMLIIFAFLFWSGIYTYRVDEVPYWIIFAHIFLVSMCWNLFDLVVMDWLIFCIRQPKYMVLPGSEGHKAYRDFRFHFIGFLKGTVISLLGSGIAAGICYAVLKLLIW